MPKPVKKAARTLKVPPKPAAGERGKTSQKRAAQIALTKQLIRETAGDPDDKPPTVDELSRAHLAELGAKGGTVTSAERLKHLRDRRQAIAGAAVRWSKRPR